MTELLEKAVEAVRQMPPEEQDHIAQAMLSMARIGAELEDIEPEHLAAVLEGIAQAEQGKLAKGSASEILAAAFRRHAR